MEANEFTNDTQPQQDVPEFEKELDQTLPVNDGSFEEALGLPYDQEVARAESVRSEQMKLAQEPTEVAPPQPTPTQENPDNESVRSSYWQSQADQLRNQLNEVQQYMPMVDYLRSNPQAVQNIQGQPAQPQAEAPTQEEEFPAPPAKPEMPRGYSREEAYSDPSSESAKYLDEVEQWRDTMTQYNQLSSQYQVAKVQEMYDQKIDGLEKINLQRENAIREQNAMNNARQYVAANYDLGDKLDDFITEMSDDNSINMDDLVGYFKYKNGMMNTPQAQNAPTPPPPSRAFNQTRRAQAVPTPMNVQSGQTNQPKDPVVGFMDELISGDGSKDIL
jgi:hypothetical protein